MLERSFKFRHVKILLYLSPKFHFYFIEVDTSVHAFNVPQTLSLALGRDRVNSLEGRTLISVPSSPHGYVSSVKLSAVQQTYKKPLQPLRVGAFCSATLVVIVLFVV